MTLLWPLKMEQILLTYGLPKTNRVFVAASHQTRLDTRSKARRPINRHSHNDAILKHQSESPFSGGRRILLRHRSRVLQGDTLVLYLFIICLDYVFRTSIGKIKENGFKVKKKKKKRKKGTPQKQLPTPTTSMI